MNEKIWSSMENEFVKMQTLHIYTIEMKWDGIEEEKSPIFKRSMPIDFSIYELLTFFNIDSFATNLEHSSVRELFQNWKLGHHDQFWSA
jgi:hypothetical protein